MPGLDFERNISQRMAIIEEATRLQLALGASHLQQVEMAPEAYGLTAATRAPVRRPRRRRNSALHGRDSPSSSPPEELHSVNSVLPGREVELTPLPAPVAPHRPTPSPTTTTAAVGTQTGYTH